MANNLVGNTVETILGNGQADVVSIGLVISLWAGSSAMSAFVESITIAYGQHEARHPVAERFFALGLYLLALLAGIIILPLLAIGPDYLPRLFPESWRAEVSDIVNCAYYPAIADRPDLHADRALQGRARSTNTPGTAGVPGALLAAAVFIVASFGLRLYLSYVYSHGLTYGALATPITFLTSAQRSPVRRPGRDLPRARSTGTVNDTRSRPVIRRAPPVRFRRRVPRSRAPSLIMAG